MASWVEQRSQGLKQSMWLLCPLPRADTGAGVLSFASCVVFGRLTGCKHAPHDAGINTFFGRAAALISATNNVSNIAKVMTKIGAICLVTIGAWIVIQLGVQFGLYRHTCGMGAGEVPSA